eukprot:gene11847-15853_t
MASYLSYAIIIAIFVLHEIKCYTLNFESKSFKSLRSNFNPLKSNNDNSCIMINGLPGLMALETAKVCLDRGYNILPIGFTGPRCNLTDYVVHGKYKSQSIRLGKGPGIDDSAANSVLKSLKNEYPELVIIDYTSPTAVINNIKAYVANNCDFVMGTTGVDLEQILNEFEIGANYAVIAPNMAKQIVALQAALVEMVKRFPGSFVDYKLKVTESHQSSKVDTSGTAKAIVKELAVLNGQSFSIEDIEKIRTVNEQLNFGVPKNSLNGHAFHTYQLVSSDGSVLFELKHNVCGRTIYAEGTADAVKFIEKIRKDKPEKRLYNMIDVLECGDMR